MVQEVQELLSFNGAELDGRTIQVGCVDDSSSLMGDNGYNNSNINKNNICSNNNIWVLKPKRAPGTTATTKWKSIPVVIICGNSTSAKMVGKTVTVHSFFFKKLAIRNRGLKWQNRVCSIFEANFMRLRSTCFPVRSPKRSNLFRLDAEAGTRNCLNKGVDAIEGQVTRKKVTTIRFFEIFWDFWDLFQDFWDFPRFFHYFSRIFGIFETFFKIFRIFGIFFWDFWDFFSDFKSSLSDDHNA